MLTKITDEFYVDFSKITMIKPFDGGIYIFIDDGQPVTLLDHSEDKKMKDIFLKKLDEYLGEDLAK